MSEKIEIIKASEFGLDEKKAVAIQSAFSPMIAEKDALTELYNAIIVKELTEEVCNEARLLRLKLVKVRTGTKKIHSAEKQYFIAAGKFVDAWKNKNTVAVELMESKLSEMENYFAIKEKERIEKLTKERNASVMAFTEFLPEDLGKMDESVFENYLSGLKLSHQQKIEAEAKAEAERLEKIRLEEKEKAEKEKAEKEERERIAAENIRLKKEAEERERAIAEERRIAEEKAEAERLERVRIEQERFDKLEAERLERERIATIERKKQEAKLEAERIERERIAAEKEAERLAELKAIQQKAEKERLEREKLQAEKDAKEKAEAEAILLAKEEAEKELQKGDAEKFETLISDLKELKTKYSFEYELNKKKMNQTAALLDKIINHISE